MTEVQSGRGLVRRPGRREPAAPAVRRRSPMDARALIVHSARPLKEDVAAH